SYCSFTSGEIDKLHKYVEPYVNKLCMEIDRTLQLIRDNNLQIINVYFGGGTPTSLSCEQLKKILQHLDVKPREYCIEAGRPDTIDEEKLDLFQEYGVNRISINPQTFNQRILDKVGRKHTVKDIYNKFCLARQYNFIINMDLIAGLPSEMYQEFCYSVDETIKLHPDNITVHTLAIKRGSLLRNAEESNYSEENNVNEMVRYSHTRLYQEGYAPYYLYRQKYMKDNLENVGFCRNHTPSLYNIDIMEETRSIVACGTNAISKRVFSEENRIERCANPKDVITYIDRLEEFIERKERLFRRK
ncbi:MAG: coproporphyrinogen dehydrogenase HemZ, partial [Clostridia bacterium]